MSNKLCIPHCLEDYLAVIGTWCAEPELAQTIPMVCHGINVWFDLFTLVPLLQVTYLLFAVPLEFEDGHYLELKKNGFEIWPRPSY